MLIMLQMIQLNAQYYWVNWKKVINKIYHPIEPQVKRFLGKLKLNKNLWSVSTVKILTMKLFYIIMDYNMCTISNKFVILHINIRSIEAHYIELLCHLKQLKKKPDITICTKSWKIQSFSLFNIFRIPNIL